MKIKSEVEMIQLGKTIAEQIKVSKYESLVIYLKGNLGTGKTTFSKGFLKGMGFNELVNSPTYNLIETIETTDFIIYHVDLYRIESLNEILELELHEKPIVGKPYIFLIEWPENGGDYILSADLIIDIAFGGMMNERLINIQMLSKKVRKFEDSWIK